VTCKELIEFLSEYLDGGLPSDVAAAFEKHLAICPDCVAYIASYHQTIDLAKKAIVGPDSPVPDDVPEDLVEAILAAKPKL
jgi:anti-sigma factor RsiW